MPTILRVKGYRFFFFSNERKEPAHIHIEQAENYAKFWLEPITLAQCRGFRSHELSQIHGIIMENVNLFKEKWNEYFAY